MVLLSFLLVINIFQSGNVYIVQKKSLKDYARSNKMHNKVTKTIALMISPQWQGMYSMYSLKAFFFFYKCRPGPLKRLCNEPFPSSYLLYPNYSSNYHTYLHTVLNLESLQYLELLTLGKLNRFYTGTSN